MGDRGLNTSLWAAGSNREAQFTPRPGDWTCPSCDFSNFRRRKECFRCSFMPTSAGFKDNAAEKHGYRTPDIMPSSQDLDPQGGIESHKAIRGINPELTKTPTLHIRRVNNERAGLYTSRWAPRNSRGRPNVSEGGEVWTKVLL